MKNKKLLYICSAVALLLVVSVILLGCAAKYESPSHWDEDNFINGSDSDLGYDKVEISESGEVAELPDRKIIYTVSVDLVVSDVKTAYENLQTKINADEWIDRSRMSDYNATIDFRIKTSRINEFIESLKSDGSVSSVEKSSKDVSVNYYDSTVRKQTLITEQTRLLSLLESAENISDCLAITKRLSEIETQLKQIDGELKNYDSLIEYSKVSVYICKTSEPIAEETFGDKVKYAFEIVGNIAEGLFIFILAALPFMAVIAAITLVIVFSNKKAKAKKQAAQKAQLEKQQQELNKTREKAEQILFEAEQNNQQQSSDTNEASNGTSDEDVAR